MYPKNKKVSKTEAIKEMLNGKKMFMTLWRHEMPKYVYYDGSSFKWDNGSHFENINTMAGDFRIIEE